MQIQSIRVFHETPLFHSIFKIHNYIEGFHETSHIQIQFQFLIIHCIIQLFVHKSSILISNNTN